MAWARGSSSSAADENLLSEGDRSLRDMLSELRRYRTSLAQVWPQVTRGVGLLAPGRDAQVLSKRLSEIAQEVEDEIEAKRFEGFRKRAQAKKIEGIGSAIEAALLGEPAQVPFFDRFRGGPSRSMEKKGKRTT